MIKQLTLIGVLILLSGCSKRIILNDYELLTPDGTKIENSLFANKTVFINYWATWCGPCIEEMPSIDRLAKEMKDEDIFFIAISDESLEKINQFVRKEKYDFFFAKKVLKPGEKEMRSFPETYLISPSGKVIYHKTGSTQWDNPEMIAQLKRLLRANGL